jgi:voltage-gated sodium channel
VLRLVSVSPQLRKVVGALLGAIPGLSSIIVILLLLFYVFAVMATGLFAARFPEWFGSVGESMYSLFQIMTLESWSMGIVRPVMEVYPYAWVFFIPFIVIATFTMLNLFIAIIVNALQSEHAANQEKTLATVTRSADEIAQALHEEIQAMRGEIQGLRSQIESWERNAEGRTAKEGTG